MGRVSDRSSSIRPTGMFIGYRRYERFDSGNGWDHCNEYRFEGRPPSLAESVANVMHHDREQGSERLRGKETNFFLIFE